MAVERYVPERKKKLAVIDKKKLAKNARPNGRNWGGARKGAGSHGGAKRHTVQHYMDKYPVMPLDHMLEVLNAPEPTKPKTNGNGKDADKAKKHYEGMVRRYEARKDDMAKAAAPFMHARLSNVELKGELEQKVQHSLDLKKLSDDELMLLEKLVSKSQIVDLLPDEYEDVTED